MGEPEARSGERKRARVKAGIGLYKRLYETEVLDRIGLIKHGVAAVEAKRWLDLPELGRMAALKALDVPVATFNKKVKANARLSPAESEKVMGFARLVGQVEVMVQGADDATGFDAVAWLAGWLIEPLPALGHARPIDLMGTIEGQSLVSRTLAQIASGAYA